MPVNLINKMVLNPDLWSKALSAFNKDDVQKFTTFLSGFSQSLIFVVCPPIFKFLADSEGSSSSMEKAEQKAMIFFWYFYIVVRFLGQIVLNGIQQFFNGGKYNTSVLFLSLVIHSYPFISLLPLIIGGTAEAVVTSGLSTLGNSAPLNLGPTAISYIIFSGGKYNTPVILFLSLLLIVLHSYQFVSFFVRLQVFRGLYSTCVSTTYSSTIAFVFAITTFLPI